jgi:small subunit ribosomal protein S7
MWSIKKMVKETKTEVKAEKAPAKVAEKPVEKVAKPVKIEKKVAPKPEVKESKAPVAKKVETVVKSDTTEQSSATPSKKSEGAPKTEETPKTVAKPEPKVLAFNFKLFDKWDQQVVVADAGLRRYITLTPRLVPFSQGRNVKKQFWKSENHIVERLILKLMVTGHKGKKHFHTSGHHTGKYSVISREVRKAFEIIEAKTKRNPLEVYIRALENGSPCEGVTTIEYGGVRYPKAVDLSPQRRIDLALRWICQGSYHAKAGRGKKVGIAESLANQLMLSAAKDQAANAVQKAFETERSAVASR